MITDIVKVGLSIIDKIIPDPEQREKAKLELLKQEQEGKLKENEVALSAIIAEAKSSDPWTSRARPSFLYCMYIMILASIPMGIVFAINPTVAEAVITGVKGWLQAIPEPMWALFGAGYLGYVGARSYDKGKK